MRRRIVAGSLVCLLIFPLAMIQSGCGPNIQQNMRKSSLGVLTALGAIQDLEKSAWDSQQALSEADWVISRDAHRRFNARMEQLLIVGQAFNKTVWMYPASAVALEQAKMLTELLSKLSLELVASIPDGPTKTGLLITIQTANAAINTALIIVMESR